MQIRIANSTKDVAASVSDVPDPSKSLSENSVEFCGEGFWLQPRRRGRSIPAAGCDGRANAGRRQKTRRPEGFRGKGRLASLLLGHSPTAGMLPRRASPSSLFHENRTPRNFQTGSQELCILFSFRVFRTITHKSLLRLRRFSSSPHDEGVGRGPRRGAIQRNQRASSPQPSPPSDGGEGVNPVAALPRWVRSWLLTVRLELTTRGNAGVLRRSLP